MQTEMVFETQSSSDRGRNIYTWQSSWKIKCFRQHNSILVWLLIFLRTLINVYVVDTYLSPDSYKKRRWCQKWTIKRKVTFRKEKLFAKCIFLFWHIVYIFYNVSTSYETIVPNWLCLRNYNQIQFVTWQLYKTVCYMIHTVWTTLYGKVFDNKYKSC